MATQPLPDDGDELLDDLTPDQREAVTHFHGPLLILAGAGSGKTRVITRRVAWLLREGVRAHNVLAITFTNKAAGEMRQRVDALVPGNRVLVSTFHALGARLLRQYHDRFRLDRNFTIYDTTDRARLVKEAHEAAGLDDSRFTPDRIGGAISKAKNQLLTPADYAAKAGDFFAQAVAAAYPLYERRLREANALDFDDLLLMPALALKRDAELRAELDARFQFVLIDEYQDTNSAQYAIARGLSVDHPNLCVVGDPDQSIYKWRGSDIRNILDFERDFPDARVITLDRNYRSTPNILRAASVVIDHNTQRKKKSLLTDNPEGEPVRVLTFDTGLDEADRVAGRIARAVRAGKRQYRDFAIFLRINALSRTLESAFVKHGVPFQIVKGLAFFDRKENRDVLAYLRLLVNPQDRLSFLRVVNEPPRGIGKVTLEHLQGYAETHSISLLAAAGQVDKIPAIKGKAATGLRDFARIMADLRAHLDDAPDAVIRAVLDRSGYRDMLKNSSDDDDQERLANIEEFITAARQFSAGRPDAKLGDFLEQITLASDVDAWDEQADHVSVMTLHAAKGLEFPVVYMMAVEQGILPHERSLAHDEDVEEERRLCFVGMTRAKRELYLCHARAREFRGQELYAVPSMFLDELPGEVERLDLSGRHRHSSAADEYRDEGWEDTGIRPIRPKVVPPPPKPSGRGPVDAEGFGVGVVVNHPDYKIGQIVSIAGFGATRRIKVLFPSAGEKTFMGRDVPIRPIGKK
jgi:DNA helicase-2/ATP-dependent DNA helicase PcrA